MNQSTHQNAMQCISFIYACNAKKKKERKTYTHTHTKKKTVEDNKKRMNIATLQIYMQI